MQNVPASEGTGDTTADEIVPPVVLPDGAFPDQAGMVFGPGGISGCVSVFVAVDSEEIAMERRNAGLSYASVVAVAVPVVVSAAVVAGGGVTDLADFVDSANAVDFAGDGAGEHRRDFFGR